MHAQWQFLRYMHCWASIIMHGCLLRWGVYLVTTSCSTNLSLRLPCCTCFIVSNGNCRTQTHIEVKHTEICVWACPQRGLNPGCSLAEDATIAPYQQTKLGGSAVSFILMWMHNHHSWLYSSLFLSWFVLKHSYRVKIAKGIPSVNSANSF